VPGVRRGLRAIAILAACLAALVAFSPPAGAQVRIHRLHHVWVFVMENHSLGQILGNPQAPFLNRMARRYRVATRFYAPAHPSLPNYLAMISGSTQGCGSDHCNRGIRGPTLARQLSRNGLGWGGYFEGLPHRGYTGGDRGNYIRHHNPFVYFRSVTSKPRQRRHIQRLRAFPRSLRRPPGLSFVVPDNSHNMHSSSVRTGDRWLAYWVPRVMRSRAYRRGGTILIVWDESHNDRSGCCLPRVHGGRIPLFVIARNARNGHRIRRAATTYSLLSTLESGFGLPRLGFATLARPFPPPI
jgi:phosphatidylinositol-3-phosphatase